MPSLGACEATSTEEDEFGRGRHLGLPPRRVRDLITTTSGMVPASICRSVYVYMGTRPRTHPQDGDGYGADARGTSYTRPPRWAGSSQTSALEVPDGHEEDVWKVGFGTLEHCYRLHVGGEYWVRIVTFPILLTVCEQAVSPYRNC